MALPINIDKLLRGKVVEWERLDFKKGWNPDDVLHTACAFANDIHNWGGGYIIVGVEEKAGMPVLPPCGIPAEIVDGIQKEIVKISNIIQPVCNIILEPVEVEGKLVLVIWVPGGDARPYKAPVSVGKENCKQGKRYYVRQGSVTRIANERDEQQLLRIANKIPFDDRLCHQATMDDLSPLQVKDFLRRVGSRLSVSDVETMPFEQLCWNMQIVGGTTEYVRPKNVGLLFFCDNPEKYIPCSHIEIVRFGKDVSSVFDEKILSGPVHVQLQQALDYLKSQVLIEKVSKMDGQAEAVRTWNYPYEALEEMVANAVYHKSWDERTPIEICIYPDKIQVYNVEGPMPPVTNADLKKERVVTREYRNRRVGDFLKELGLTEGRNTGLPKIYSSLHKNGSPLPEFETDSTNRYFMATLYIHPSFVTSGTIDTENTTENTTEKTTENTTEKILHLMQENPRITMAELARLCNLSEDGIYFQVKGLRKRGIVYREGARKNGHWVVKS